MDGEAGILDEDRCWLRVPLHRLLALADPLRDDPWRTGVTEGLVRVMLAVPGTPVILNEDPAMLGPRDAVDWDAARIVQFYRDGWDPIETDADPILVDVGTAEVTPRWVILDGNHRVAAAKLRGSLTVDVAVQGDWDLALELLGPG